jgi:hypothetical protein
MVKGHMRVHEYQSEKGHELIQRILFPFVQLYPTRTPR